MENGCYAFLSPPLGGGEGGGLGATYDVHLSLIEKRVVDVLLVLTCLLGVTAEALRASAEPIN